MNKAPLTQFNANPSLLTRVLRFFISNVLERRREKEGVLYKNYPYLPQITGANTYKTILDEYVTLEADAEELFGGDYIILGEK